MTPHTSSNAPTMRQSLFMTGLLARANTGADSRLRPRTRTGSSPEPNLDLLAAEIRHGLDGDRPARLSLERLEALRFALGQEGRHLGVHAQRDPGGVGVHCRLAQRPAQRVVGERLERARAARASAVRARAGQQLLQALAGTLARHLDEAELRDAQHVRTGLVLAERLLEGVEDLLAVRGLLHIDEVDHDDAADVAQPELLDDLLCRLEVDAQDRLLLVLLADVASGVDVHRGQRLRLVEDQV